MKLSKFLARTRVAASKCRQKKEWTKNLEDRARELRRSNQSLAIIVKFLREDIIFLIGEIWEHNSGDCDQIQSFMGSGTNFSNARSGKNMCKHKQTRIEMMPVSPGSRPDCREVDEVERTSPTTARSIADDESAMEALPRRSINNDKNEESVASEVGE